MSPRFSTTGVIATYNQSAFVAEAVASLADQVDELVVVDDASSDDTVAVLGGLPHSNLRLVRNERRLGVSRSFNVGVEMGTGEIVVIQGGDDRSTPDRVERQLRSFDDPHVVLSASVPRVLNEFGAVLPDWCASEFFPDTRIPDTLVHLFSLGNLICAPSVSLRRSDYLDLGGFHAGLDHLQDYHLWLRLAERGTFDILPVPVVEYRKHTTNLSRVHLDIDSPRSRRIWTETEFVLTDFLERSRPETLVRLGAAGGVEPERFSRLVHEEQVGLLELLHQNRLLVRRGLAFVLRRLGEKDGEESLARMGLSVEDVDRLAVRADPMNGEDVGRALAVREKLDESSTRGEARKNAARRGRTA
ncbi:MAG TPA: glycosyltransferase [Lacisediminihabitans sp.]|uniref:glycosyltransferase family 2 protein n=1 Tax=Lacisediminihabitans sp. TaxID=2787631 RepID=UPI002EDB9916